MFMVGSKRLLITGLVLLSVTGCGSGVQFSIGQTSQSFTQKGTTVDNAIDVLWVVDNSGSMEPLQANLTANFSSFISNFQTQGYDFHMAVTTTDVYKSEANFLNNPALAKFGDGVGATPSGVFVILSTTPNLDDVFVNNATTGINGSGDERAFSSMRDALNSPLNAGFLRANSFFAIVILSDEDDFSNANRPESSWGNNDAADHCYYDTAMDTAATTTYSGPDHVSTCANLNPQTPPDTVASYESYLDTLTQTTGASRRYNVNTITVLDSACQLTHSADPDSNVTIIGQRYVQMTNDTNGVSGSICDASYAAALSQISNQITVLSTQFYLNRIPQVSTITVWVNGVMIPQDPNNGWTYSSSSNSVQFHGTATPAQNATISVDFSPVSIAT
jgi:hypothetical protein